MISGTEKYSRKHLDPNCPGSFEHVDTMDWDGNREYMYACDVCGAWYVNSYRKSPY